MCDRPPTAIVKRDGKSKPRKRFALCYIIYYRRVGAYDVCERSIDLIDTFIYVGRHVDVSVFHEQYN